MSVKGNISRDRIIEAANRLVYTKGYNQMSVSEVASAVGITKGNLHYHFKSKEALLSAVIQFRKESIVTMLEEWDEMFPVAKDKLKRFVKMLMNEEKEIIEYGCPMGTLNAELGKFQPALKLDSKEMFDLFQHWLEKVFKEIEIKKSKMLSMHLLSMAQGAAMMSYVYSNSQILKDECDAMINWIDKL